MPRPVIFIARRLPDAVLARAEKSYEIIVNYDDVPYSSDQIIEMSANVDGIVACHSEQFPADVVDALDPRVKIVANYSVGTDHCDLAAFAARGIAVTNTPDVLSDATAEITLLLLLGAARRAVEGDQMVRGGEWKFWSPSFMVGKQVTGRRLGIIGMGRVGRAVARNARGLNMQIHYYNRNRLSSDAEAGAIFHETIESLLPVSDFLSLHCPATAETKGIMTAERFALLPKGAVFVNAARGSLVDEAALIGAIESGGVSAAGLDCFVSEPGGNPAFSKYQNIFMLPHIGSSTEVTRDAMGFRALDNLDAFFAGETPRDLK
jgi:lactate dehydrogenase-like 2-hydroxyacid dehydrogenase